MKMVLGSHLCIGYKECNDILNLYSLFLTNGINYITIPSYTYFRSITHSLLHTKLVYHNPLYITDQHEEVECFHALYQGLQEPLKNLNDMTIDHDLDEIAVYNDIILIEQTSTIITNPRYKKLIKHLETKEAFKATPVIIASEDIQQPVT